MTFSSRATALMIVALLSHQAFTQCVPEEIKEAIDEVLLLGGDPVPYTCVSDGRKCVSARFERMEIPPLLITRLSRLKRLATIEFEDVEMQPEAWGTLGKMHQLRNVDIRSSKTKLDSTILFAISRLPELRGISLESDAIALESLGDELTAFDKLVFLRIAGCELTPSGCRAISKRCPNLEELQLHKVTSVREGFSVLTHLPRLKTLRVSYSRLSANWLGSCANCVCLQELDIASNGIRDSDLSLLANCKRLTILRVKEGQCKFGSIDRLTQLSTLWIDSEDNAYTALNDDGMAAIARLTCLKALHISDGEAVTENGWIKLASLTDLEELRLFQIGAMPSTIANAMSRKSLRKLILWDVKWSEECANTVAAMGNLKVLDLNWVDVKDESLSIMTSRQSLLNLVELRIHRVSDAGLELLSKMKSLRKLYISTGYTKQGVEKFKMALPNCIVNKE